MWCLLCDMDGGLQPHVPQQSQPLPEPPSLLSAGIISCAVATVRAIKKQRGKIFSRLTALGDRDSHSHQSKHVNQLGGQHMDSMREEEVEDGSNAIYVKFDLRHITCLCLRSRATNSPMEVTLID
jgi:hypothetical protein